MTNEIPLLRQVEICLNARDALLNLVSLSIRICESARLTKALT